MTVEPPALGESDRQLLLSMMLRSNLTGPRSARFVEALTTAGLRLERPFLVMKSISEPQPDKRHPERK